MMPEPLFDASVAQWQAWGCAQLAGEEARRESELLLGHALQRERAWLFAHAGDRVEGEPAQRFAALIAQRREGVPVAQLLGEWGFWTLRLQVTRDTLIPRPETELLVEAALARLVVPAHLVVPAQAGTQGQGASGSRTSLDARNDEDLPHRGPRKAARRPVPSLSKDGDEVRIADLGTGTGAIALALASERPHARVVATDASPAALAVARGNALRNDIANVEFREGDWYQPLSGERFDLIVSNPPYIADTDVHLSQGDLRFEPRGALASGADGLDAIRELARGAREHLLPGGWLLLEHGFEQGAAVRDLLLVHGLIEVETLPDLEARDRVTVGRAR